MAKKKDSGAETPAPKPETRTRKPADPFKKIGKGFDVLIERAACSIKLDEQEKLRAVGFFRGLQALVRDSRVLLASTGNETLIEEVTNYGEKKAAPKALEF